MDASVWFYDPDTTNSVYDEETNEYTSIPVTIYAGKARAQPLRAANPVQMPGNTTTVQTVLFSIPIDNNDLDLKIGTRGEILVAPLNPSLTQYVYYISEFMDSSNPIEKTFLCRVNQELRNDG